MGTVTVFAGKITDLLNQCVCYSICGRQFQWKPYKSSVNAIGDVINDASDDVMLCLMFFLTSYITWHVLRRHVMSNVIDDVIYDAYCKIVLCLPCRRQEPLSRQAVQFRRPMCALPAWTSRPLSVPGELQWLRGQCRSQPYLWHRWAGLC